MPTQTSDLKATIKLNHLGRWYIEHYYKSYMAWSTHNNWVPHWRGCPTNVGISNFETLQAAINFAHEHHLETSPVGNGAK